VALRLPAAAAGTDAAAGFPLSCAQGPQAARGGRFAAALRALPLEAPERAEPFDLVLVGSDEVWNLRHPWYGAKPIFYGVGLKAERLVSYAASFGNHDASERLDGWWADRLRSFAAISVRDENSRDMVRNAVGVEPEVVLDPCLQFPPSAPAREAQGEPYVAIYGHSFDGDFVAAAQAAGLRHRREGLAFRALYHRLAYRQRWEGRTSVRR
jgi:hypothetical protein